MCVCEVVKLCRFMVMFSYVQYLVMCVCTVLVYLYVINTHYPLPLPYTFYTRSPPSSRPSEN
ncbi:hypothetical protein EON63_25315 [archaeon]|nr:MAG: hypothetical protein EON63_25315 [archaeon]